MTSIILATNNSDQPIKSLSEQEWTAKWGVELTREPQAFACLPDRAYRELPGQNASLLKKVVDKTAYHAWKEYIDPYRKPAQRKDAFVIGSIFHTALNEPTELNNRFVVMPADMPNRPTARQLEQPKPKKDGTHNKEAVAYKNWEKFVEAEQAWVEFLSLHKGKEIITQDHFDQGNAQAAAVLNHPVIGDFYKNHPWNKLGLGNELTLTYIDSVTNARLKARIDALRIIDGSLVALDTKGTLNAGSGPDNFGKEASNFLYILQAAFYIDAVFYCQQAIEQVFDLPSGSFAGINKVFRFIAVEKQDPCPQTIGFYDVSDEDIGLGRMVYRKALNEIVSAHNIGFYPGYSTAPQQLELPAYGIKRLRAYIDS